MKPVHELTPDQAVLELERVSDLLMERSTPALLARKTELEAWILMHQVKADADAPVKSGPLAALGAPTNPKEAAMTTGEGKPPHHGALKSPQPQPEPAQESPMPNPKRLTDEEKRAKNREYNREWARKKAAAAKADVPQNVPENVQIPVQIVPAKVDQLRAEATIPTSPEALQIALIKRLREIRAKLQAAEAASEETLAIFEDQRKRFGKCREDLKTAEAEVAELREELKNWTENGFQYDWEQECIRLQAESNALSDTADRMEQERDKARAEVARLREREGALESQLDYLNEEFGAVATERDRLQAEVARLKMILHNADADYHKAQEFLLRGKVGPATVPFCPICDAIDGEARQDNATIRTRIAEIEAEHAVCKQLTSEIIRTATEAALAWVWRDCSSELFAEEAEDFVTRGLAELLGGERE